MTVEQYGSEMGRWAAFSHEEACLIHHALRMLAKHPLVNQDAEPATRLADEFWNLHSQRVNATDFWRPEGKCPETCG